MIFKGEMTKLHERMNVPSAVAECVGDNRTIIITYWMRVVQIDVQSFCYCFATGD